MLSYEERLNGEPAWALREGSEHFGGASSVHKALTKMTRRLEELRVPYVIADGMALFFHGYRRFTEDVDIVVTAEGLRRLHHTHPVPLQGQPRKSWHRPARGFPGTDSGSSHP